LTKLLAHRRGYANIEVRSTKLLAQLNAIQSSVESMATRCDHVKVAATEDVTSYLLEDARLDIVTPSAAIGRRQRRRPVGTRPRRGVGSVEEASRVLIDNIQTATPLTDELVAQAKSSHVPVIKVTETMRGTNYCVSSTASSRR